MLWPIAILLIGTHENGSEAWNLKSDSKDIAFNLEHHWNNFKLTYNKEYDTTIDEMRRKMIFHENLKKINEHNKRYEQGHETFQMGVNHFADMTSEEFDQLHQTDLDDEEINGSDTDYNIQRKGKKMKWFKKEIQWYTPLIPVRNQGKCGSCWAFASTGLLEYDYYYRHGKVLSLSEQQLLDCIRNLGCSGGDTFKTLEYIKKRGIENQVYNRPYIGKKAECLYEPSNALKLIKSIRKLKKTEEESIYRRLKQGPVKISIYAKPDAFQHYKSGFITAEKCSNKERTNHAVVLLGAVKEDGIPLWYIRNSYGPDWGINGHAKLLMGENTCGMLRQKSVYVTVK